MRGPLAGVDPLLAPVLFSFEQAREDLEAHTAGLSGRELWARPYGLTSVGFHLRHIAGSVGRLTAYLEGKPLTSEQLQALAEESTPEGTTEELLEALHASLRQAEAAIRAVDSQRLTEARWVGRKRLPTTVIGLLVHIAEHTQRHVGQAIAAAKLARACTGARPGA